MAAGTTNPNVYKGQAGEENSQRMTTWGPEAAGEQETCHLQPLGLLMPELLFQDKPEIANSMCNVSIFKYWQLMNLCFLKYIDQTKLKCALAASLRPLFG